MIFLSLILQLYMNQVCVCGGRGREGNHESNC